MIDTTRITTENIQTTYFSRTTQIGQTSVKLTSQNAPTTSILSISTHPNRCKEMEVINEQRSKMITVIPNEIPKEQKIDFQPTSIRGVSFPPNNTKPTIIVDFGTPLQIQSITIPRDKTPYANVEQFQVTFYSINGNKINQIPILSNLSPKDNKTIPAKLNWTLIPSNTSVAWIEITILCTTDNTSPKGVILDVKACTQPTQDGNLHIFML